MNQGESINSLLKPRYFWDVDVSKLDDKKNQRLIIERIMIFGSLKEINLLIKHYGRPQVIGTCLNIAYFDPKTLNFVSKLFDLPKDKFKCHTGKPLKLQLWNS